MWFTHDNVKLRDWWSSIHFTISSSSSSIHSTNKSTIMINTKYSETFISYNVFQKAKYVRNSYLELVGIRSRR
jgi:hypothetical protein